MNEQLRMIWDIVEKDTPEHGTHGFEHTKRVYELCKGIGEGSDADMSILLPAALLHDIARGEPNHAIAGSKKAYEILIELNYDAVKAEVICAAISTHSFSGEKKPQSLEGKILSDADKLDAMGAVGIYRAAMYSGELLRSQEDFIAHFYDKLLSLRDLMFTDTARALAEERHQYMVEYLEELDKELS